MKKSLRIALALAVLTTLPPATSFAADGLWAREHPRRAQVDERLEHQDRRIRREVREGEMTPQQGAALHAEDHQIRQEERQMARQNGGHLTRAEQRALNQQENAVSRQIGR